MITLEKTFAGESLQAIIALQSEYTSLAQIKACAKVFSESHDNEYQAIAIFNDNTMLHISDSSKGLQYDNEFDQDFIDFFLSVLSSYKKLDLCFEFDNLKECFKIVESFDDKKQTLFAVLLSEYSYSYDIVTLVNYCNENARFFEGSISDYAYELIGDCFDTKNIGTLANYIDYDSFGRDILLSGAVVELGYNLFWTNPNDIY